jgi:hypothetical protein
MPDIVRACSHRSSRREQPACCFGDSETGSEGWLAPIETIVSEYGAFGSDTGDRDSEPAPADEGEALGTSEGGPETLFRAVRGMGWSPDEFGAMCRYRVMGTPEGVPGGEYVARGVVIAEPYVVAPE